LGYSLYEIEVHEAGATGITPPRPVMVLPNDFSLDANYPNPFNPGNNSDGEYPQTAHVSVVCATTILGKKWRRS